MLTRLSVLITLSLITGACGGNKAGKNADNTETDSSKRIDQKNDTPGQLNKGSSISSPNRLADQLLLDTADIQPPRKPVYRSLETGSMPFKLKIPENWSIQEKPDAGDGYRLKVAYGKADVRVYQEATKSRPQGIEPPDCKEKEEFQFRNQSGKKCIQSDAIYYYLTRQNQRLVFYVKASQQWLDQHKQQVEKVARSLAFKQEDQLSQLINPQ